MRAGLGCGGPRGGSGSPDRVWLMVLSALRPTRVFLKLCPGDPGVPRRFSEVEQRDGWSKEAPGLTTSPQMEQTSLPVSSLFYMLVFDGERYWPFSW